MSDIPYSVRGSVTSVNKLRGFNFDTIGDNEMFKKVDATNVGGTNLISTETADANILRMNIDNPTIKGTAGIIEAQIVGTTKKLYLNSTGDRNDGITITSDGRVGIGITDPGENLEVDGSIQIDSAEVARLKFQQTGMDPHDLGEIDGEQDGVDGGDLQFYTKEDGGSVTEKLRINNIGAIGIGGATYGTAGDVIISNGPSSSVSWRTPVILGASLTNSSYSGSLPSTVVLYDNVEFETVNCYNTSTGVFTAPRTAYYMVNAYARVTDFATPFTAPRTAYYMVNAYARVTDFATPFASRAISYIYKKVGGIFTPYSVIDQVDTQENLKVATPTTNIIIYLNSGEEIRHQVVFSGNTGAAYAIRGDAFEIRCSYLSIHSIN
jgi:hypothetical protein